VHQTAVLQPSISAENDRKIDTFLSADNTVMLKFSTWTDDLGWTCQKTIEIAPEMLDDLHHTIAAMRYRVNRRKADQGDSVSDSRIVEFPSFA
jgi:hypothetical protein